MAENMDGRAESANEEEAGSLAAAFGKWLVASGRYTKMSAKDRKGALKALMASWEGMPEAGFAGTEDDPAFLAAVSSMSARRAKDAKVLPKLLALMEADRAEMTTTRSFNFFEVNPGLSALGFAAETAGGRPCGVDVLPPEVFKVYWHYHGGNSVYDVREKPAPDVVLANVPFSAFAALGKGDPETDFIVRAAASHRHAKATLLRMDWTAGERLGLDPAAHADAFARHFQRGEARWIVVNNENFVPMRGCELFVAVSSRWKDDFRVVASDPACPPASDFVYEIEHADRLRVDPGSGGSAFPKKPAERIGADYFHAPQAAVLRIGNASRMLSPVEIRDILGIPASFTVPQDLATAYHFLGDSVAVPVAGRAVRGLLRAVELD